MLMCRVADSKQFIDHWGGTGTTWRVN